jgi:hypothetical protein
MQCERLGACIISDDQKHGFEQDHGFGSPGGFTVEGFYFLARVKCRANFGRVGNLICRAERRDIVPAHAA